MRLWTQNGYFLDEVISALQKDIRRGNEYESMFWCFELIPKFEGYLWRRLIIISQEDIGLAEPSILTFLPSQRTLFFEYRDEGKDGPAKLIMANTILAMCRARKSREADHFQCVVAQDFLRGTKLAIPDYALDKHTVGGRNLGRDTDHWLGNMALTNSAGPDQYQERAEANWRKGIASFDWGKRGAKPRQANLFDQSSNPGNSEDDDLS